MSKKIIYKNALGAELELTNSAPFLLEKFNSSNNVNIYTNKGMNQDGNTYLDNTLDTRDITLDIAIVGKNNIELINYGNKIYNVFNPKIGEGYLIYKDDLKERKIKCIVNKLPYIATKITNRVNSCLISLTANNPYWLDILESKEEISLWKGDFQFELEFDKDGIEFGHREPSLIVNVNNVGDVKCGMSIQFKALATVVNPSLFNVNTREYFKINKIMVAGEKIIINTTFGEKRVIQQLNGVVTNAFNFIDFQSTFLQLNVGDNLFRYNADQNVDNLEVSIYYTPQYLGV